MARRATMLLFLLLFVRLTAAAEEIRVSFSGMAVMVRGQTTPITWTVRGTERPVRLRLRNPDPTVIDLEGGNEQIASTSGGSPNVLRRMVTALNLGQVVPEAVIVDANPATAEQIRAEFRRALTDTAAQLERASRELRVHDHPTLRQAVRSDDVLAAIASARDALRVDRPLNVAPDAVSFRELAPFYDGASEVLEEASAKVTAASVSGVMASATAPFWIDVATARAILAETARLFRANADLSPLTMVCVRTPHRGALVMLWPPSFPSDSESVTSIRDRSLYLGKYNYQVVKTARYLESRGTFNLLRDPRRTIEFPQRHSASESPAPIPLDRPPSPCR